MTVSAVGSQFVPQAMSSSAEATDAEFSKDLAAAELGQVGVNSTSHPAAPKTASQVVLQLRFQQTLAKAMADIAEARAEASAMDD
jgi:hypothetical protein